MPRPTATAKPLDEPPRIVDAHAAPASNPGSWRGPVKWVSFGLAAVGVGLGVVETLTAIQKSRDFNANVACMDDGKGDFRGGAECEKIARDQTVATWTAAMSYGLAGVFTTTGLILQFSEPASESANAHGPRRTLACGLGGSLTGATCVARW